MTQRIDNLKAWFGLTPEARKRIRDERDPNRVARHAEALARNREHSRKSALRAYHERGYKRHLRAGLLSAARRMLTPEPLDRFIKATEAVVQRSRRRAARKIRAKLVKMLRRRLENSMLRLKAGQSKSKTARELVGCDLDQLRLHLEKQFQPGMTWDNHEYAGWHVDHKTPLAKFDLAISEQRAAAFHFSNLQPLWATDNLAKGVS